MVQILEDYKQSQAVALLSNASMDVSELSPLNDGDSSDEEGRNTPPMTGNVSALRSHWELEATRHW